MGESKNDEDFFPLELIVNRRIKEIEDYAETVKERIKEKPEDEYNHSQMHDIHVALNEYRYILQRKKEILKKCK